MVAVPAPAPAITATPGKATIVFVRTSGVGSAIKFMIIDHYGRFLGESTASSHFPVVLEPGEYLFIAESENTAVMHANVWPDRVYYVEVVAKMGVLYARVGLEPVKPGTDSWKEVKGWLSGTDRFMPNAAQGQAAINADSAEIQKRIANAKEKWAGYSAAERAEVSLEPTDGAGGQVPMQAQPAPAAQPAAPGVAPTSAPAAPQPAATVPLVPATASPQRAPGA
jgi:hypothetical protein